MGFRNPITTATDPTARDLANQALTQIIPGSRLAADAIDGKTITGATVRTASAGLRWVLTGQAGDADRLLGYTGDSAEQAPGQVQVGFAPGDTSSTKDRGFLFLNPPIIGPGYVAGRPGITAYGQTRDATDPGHWQFDGAVEFTGAVTFDGKTNGVTLQDTGWIPLVLASGWTGAFSPAVRKLNGFICFRGELYGNSGAGDVQVLATPLDTVFRPASRLAPVVGAIPGTFAGVFINTDGTMTLTSTRTASPGYKLGSIVYLGT